jgi:FkbM family methyltransferase
MRKLLGKLLAALLNRTPISALRFIEDRVQAQVGKGWGAATTQEEALTVSRFANEKGLRNIVALDVGGNLGNWSADLFKTMPSARIIAFEPSKEAFEHLQQRFANNAFFRCENLALGKENSSATLFADKSASGLGSLTKRRVEHFGFDFEYQEKILVSTLDSWLEEDEQGLVPNILKMDVEGHEFDVLQGATETLRSIQIVQFEFGGSNIDTRTFFQDFWYFFSKLNFNLYRLTTKGPILINSYSEHDETFRPTNYYAVRK